MLTPSPPFFSLPATSRAFLCVGKARARNVVRLAATAEAFAALTAEGDLAGGGRRAAYFAARSRRQRCFQHIFVEEGVCFRMHV